MAGVVSGKLVEDYREQMLRRLFDGVIFNFFLVSLIPPLNGFNAKISSMVSVQFTQGIQCNG